MSSSCSSDHVGHGMLSVDTIDKDYPKRKGDYAFEICDSSCSSDHVGHGMLSAGTIDKDYPKRKGGYAFEICDSGARALLDKVHPSFPYRLVTACREDSQDLTQQHR